jgi:hypothetical protein
MEGDVNQYMSAEPAGEPVKFISTGKTDDLIVSFAIADPGIWGVISLTLLRTPIPYSLP